MRDRIRRQARSVLYAVALLSVGGLVFNLAAQSRTQRHKAPKPTHAQKLLRQGRDIFRNDTFGDEQFWTGTLQLEKAIEGAKLGGVGGGVSPSSRM
jgi:hypothetical protein